MNLKKAKSVRRTIFEKGISESGYTTGNDGSTRCTGARAVYREIKKKLKQEKLKCL